MANVTTTLPAGLISSLVSDQNLISGLGGITPSEVITSVSNFTANVPTRSSASRITPLVGSNGSNRTNQTSINNFASINVDFTTWYYLTKFYLDTIAGLGVPAVVNSYTVGMLVNLLGANSYFVNSTKRANIIGASERIAPYVGFSMVPNVWGSFAGNLYNSTIVNGTSTFTMIIPAGLNGTDFTLQILNPDGTVYATSSTVAGANGFVTFVADTVSPVVGTAYTFNVVANIFTTATYSFLTKNITFANVASFSGFNTLFVVGA
jgi:hypothetical protein